MAKDAPPAQEPQGAQGQQARMEYPVDTSHLSAAYANFARVTYMPEELILDFGLNTQLAPNPNEPVRLTHRLVVNYYTAKRLFHLLGMTIQQFEQQFGVLETDINKRARPVAPGTGGPGGPGFGPGGPGGPGGRGFRGDKPADGFQFRQN